MAQKHVYTRISKLADNIGVEEINSYVVLPTLY